MTEIEIKAFEAISRLIHADGVSSLGDGNPCSSAVSVLFYIENFLRDQGIESSVVSALSDDLETHNRECIDVLCSLGDDVHGY